MPLEARGRVLGDSRNPAICVPLIGQSRALILEEVKIALALQPDLLEWRVDHFEEASSIDTVLELSRTLRDQGGDVPLLFTLRSAREGGAERSATETESVALIETVAGTGLFDFVDVEIACPEAEVKRLVATAHAAGVRVIGSSHDFGSTPDDEAMLARFRLAAELGADAAKLAVMPKDMSDVLRLLEVTWRARQELGVPIISMAMGSLGVVTRAFGHLFGSSLSFAAGAAASAPGQLPIEELRTLFGMVKSRIPTR